VRPTPKKVGRTAPSGHRLLLQCLLAKPALGAQLPEDWRGDGTEGEAIPALLAVLREAGYALSGPALTQYFQGSMHERTLAAAEADMLSWGEAFDVDGEFAGLMNSFERDRRRHEFEVLQAKVKQGGWACLTEAELKLYVQVGR
ncbi:hypothetical protein, partial [Rhodoferax sp.]|uniref:hypothetical protein n=1 Tax=Rhodoferax sp. TaxID=50421 RepID=UPI003BB62318